MTDIVRYEPAAIGTERLGDILVNSGYFKDATDQAKAIVKVLYGAELGFGPIASMMGVYIVNGRPALSAQLIASAIQKSRRYRYRVREWTDEVCRIEFFEGNETLGESKFSSKDAERAGLKTATWSAYPRAMLWARAMSQGARAYTPDIFSGSVYTPEELQQEWQETTRTDIETGEVVDTAVYEPIKDQAPAEDRDLVRSADDQIWKNWLKVLDRAQGVGLNPQQITLPIDRNELREYGSQVLKDIMTREREAEAVGRR